MPQREPRLTPFSMTGYGRASTTGEKFRVFIEIRSVNGRYLEIRPKIPRQVLFLESVVREEISKVVRRGMVDVTVSCHTMEGNLGAAIDRKLAEIYFQQIEKLSADLKIAHGVSGLSLLRLPGVISTSEEVDLEREKEIPALIKSCLTDALAQLKEFRVKEGEKLGKVLNRELEELQKHREWILKHREDINTIYLTKLESRLKNWAGKKGGIIDENRLNQEALYYLDRSDVTEEVDRLAIHIKQCKDALESPGTSSLGKRIDFLSQEIGREVNTIGAKSDQPQVAQHVVEMKLAVERIREQAQNLE